ncbi:MAG: hypothetical protein KIS91_12205 [Anaerolineae bacterium]|nr:hypothetical protein [Anaerolineae bacterium]
MPDLTGDQPGAERARGTGEMDAAQPAEAPAVGVSRGGGSWPLPWARPPRPLAAQRFPGRARPGPTPRGPPPATPWPGMSAAYTDGEV